MCPGRYHWDIVCHVHQPENLTETIANIDHKQPVKPSIHAGGNPLSHTHSYNYIATNMVMIKSYTVTSGYLKSHCNVV